MCKLMHTGDQCNSSGYREGQTGRVPGRPDDEIDELLDHGASRRSVGLPTLCGGGGGGSPRSSTTTRARLPLPAPSSFRKSELRRPACKVAATRTGGNLRGAASDLPRRIRRAEGDPGGRGGGWGGGRRREGRGAMAGRGRAE
jgi:hypothetical protein